MPTEKEIRISIGEHLGYTGPYTDDKAEWQKACGELAAALAKWLSEGVVWEGEVEYIYRVRTRAVSGGSSIPPSREFYFKPKDQSYDIGIPCGQLVSVTVKIVEGTKDG